MSELLDKYNQIRKSREDSISTSELKEYIDNLPKFDTDSVVAAIGSGMLRFFTDNYEQADKRKDETIKSITDQIGKLIVNAAKINKQNIIDTSKSLTDLVDKAQKTLNEAITSIPETDLSGLDRAIKAIEVTDVSGLEYEIVQLRKAITSLKNKKPKQIDLTPVINAINEPTNVEFSIEYDKWDYPVKVTATEVK